MSKEIVKRKRRPVGWRPWEGATECVSTYYMVPCFWHDLSMNYGVGSFGSVGFAGPIGKQIRPRNASSPLAKKEYDTRYKLWGQCIMKVQLTRGDNR